MREPDFDLNAYIDIYRISFSQDLVVSDLMLNGDVFKHLKSFNLDNVRIIDIQQNSFFATQELVRIALNLVNLEQFINNTLPTWMTNLNLYVDDVDFNNSTSVELNLDTQLLVEIDSKGFGNYNYPDKDFFYFEYAPYTRNVFFRVVADDNLYCTRTLNKMLNNAVHYKNLALVNTTSVYQCLLLGDYCRELNPQCSCTESETKLTCENFLDFDELNFNKLYTWSPYRSRLQELVLAPIDRREILDKNLDLGPLRMEQDGVVILRNIGGFQYDSNPFVDLTLSDSLSLYIYDSDITTIEPICSIRILEPDDIGLFTEFTFIHFGENLRYTDTFCPLAFWKARTTYIEATHQSADNYLHFSELLEADTFDLETEVIAFKISESKNVVVNNRMLDRFIFRNLREFNMDGIELRTIDERAFEFTQKLNKIILKLDNVEVFLRSSKNEWMT
jgi:hypothetical protein